MLIKTVSRGRIRAAWAVAVGADLLQIVLFPLFAEGIASPLDAALDAAVGVGLTFLVGWHLAFLPSFVLELVPLVDVVPTWTLAVLIATRAKRVDAASPATPGPAESGRGQPSADAAKVIDVEASVTRAPRSNAPVS